MSSDTPKERAPMKSFLVVRSQSHTSTDRRRSLSVGFSLLHSALWLLGKRNIFQISSCSSFNTSASNVLLTSHFAPCYTYSTIYCSRGTRVGGGNRNCTHKVNDSFHLGLRLERIVLVFCLVSCLGSGTSLSLTYGSDRPLGSMGMRFLPSPTGKDKEQGEKINKPQVTEVISFIQPSWFQLHKPIWSIHFLLINRGEQNKLQVFRSNGKSQPMRIIYGSVTIKGANGGSVMRTVYQNRKQCHA